ncbi:MAG: 4a-hydroxytetrahydrobiopterin dehydratase [Propionivibrio sp.]|uniref:4a-hydroxytetrahydrobiopterin dehydratase n=1 Tax=Propionivibrio sp. TaxID=2212460 RepID=UPI001A4F3674|nr:4a-hydroxytetrahydrobiopterin dehydratase [Propionivibrio sp.]MBL8416243.1 4a-hydroxytetrahydrobiopterin dehydratase [Propionivibrio sp.]
MPETPLIEDRCRPLRGPQHRLDATQILALLKQLDGWEIDQERLHREFRFADYRSTMLFVNAVAWLAERENHHPDLEVGYSRVKVAYSTHDVGGLSHNDFICAAKIGALTSI